MIAGGGIGGLCTALVLQNQGHDVHIYEKATSYRPFGGPIQIASNALESLKRIDQTVYNAILEQSTSIGTRKNGLKDGLSNEWFATFDLYAPARRRNQDSSVVIDRPILQEILLQGIGRGTVSNGCEVTGYTKHQYSAPGNSVTGLLSNGSSVQCDLLIGSDGINSKVREKLVPRLSDPVWSGYTCFAAIANCVPDDIKDVGYKVFLGSRKYFVSVDVGGGRIQWYAFLNIPPQSLSLQPEEMCAWLKETQFSDWSEEVRAPPARRPRAARPSSAARPCARTSTAPRTAGPLTGRAALRCPHRCTSCSTTRRSTRWSSATCTTARPTCSGRRGACACSATPRTR